MTTPTSTIKKFLRKSGRALSAITIISSLLASPAQAQEDDKEIADPFNGPELYGNMLTAFKVRWDIQRDPVKYPSEFRAMKWVERGPSTIGGRTQALLIDQNDPTFQTAFAATSSGGLWRTTTLKSATPNWKPVDDFMPGLALNTIAQDPTSPKIMYIGTSDFTPVGILKSTDGGLNWAYLPDTDRDGLRAIQKIVVTADHAVIAISSDGLYYSSDGATFQQKISGDFTDITIASDRSIYAGMHSTQATIYKSTDNGKTFTPTTVSGLNDGDNLKLAASPSNPKVVYATSSNDDLIAGFIKTTNAGQTWTAATTPPQQWQPWHHLVITVDPLDEKRVWLGNADMFRTINGGRTWNQKSYIDGRPSTNIHDDHTSIVYEPGNPNVVYFGNDGGVYGTTSARDSFPAFTNKNNGFDVLQAYSVAIHPAKGSYTYLTGAQDNGTLLATSAGISTASEVWGGDGGFVHIDQNEPNIFITAGTGHNYGVSRDGGATVQDLFSADGGAYINYTDYDNIANVLYAVDKGAYYAISVNQNGASEKVILPTEGETEVSAVTCSENVAGRIWLGLTNGDVIRVENAADPTKRTIKVVRSIGDGAYQVSGISVDPADEDHYIVIQSGSNTNYIYETTNNGIEWHSVMGNLPPLPLSASIFAPDNGDQFIVGTFQGIWTTDNLNGDSTKWVLDTTFPCVRVDMIQSRKSDKEVIAGTYGRGIFSTTYFGTRNHGMSVAITSPKNLSTASSGSNILIAADASSVNSSIAEVDFYINNQYKSDDVTAPYTYTWTAPAAGAYTLSAIAYDQFGYALYSKSITVNVTAGICNFGTPRSIALTAIAQEYTHAYVIGTGGPDFSHLQKFKINWSPSNNAIYNFEINTTNGIPNWFVDMKNDIVSNTFNAANPSITIAHTGFQNFDGSYYVTIHNGNFVMADKAGRYTIYFSNSTSAPACPSSRLSVTNDVSEGTNVSPNPSSELAVISSEMDLSSARIKIEDMSGIEQLARIDVTGNKASIYVSALPAGVYMVSIVNGTDVAVKKIMVVR